MCPDRMSLSINYSFLSKYLMQLYLMEVKRNSMIYRSVYVAMILLLFSATCLSQKHLETVILHSGEARKTINFNRCWKFKLGDIPGAQAIF